MHDMCERALVVLRDGRPAREVAYGADEAGLFRQMQLLSAKPMMYVCNVDEDSAASGNDYSARLIEWAAANGTPAVIIAAAIEAEIAQLADEAEKGEFLATLGLEETGLARVIRTGYRLLDLIIYFTAGETEARAWTIPANTRAQDAAGKIHSDFARGFICAETIGYDDYLACGGEHGAKEAAKLRKEGRNYIVKDGDIILYRFNV
jgi:ribosome-binding ATPase YchF (GTP1/OBG family)